VPFLVAQTTVMEHIAMDMSVKDKRGKKCDLYVNTQLVPMAATLMMMDTLFGLIEKTDNVNEYDSTEK
jgi:hypothetical protein